MPKFSNPIKTREDGVKIIGGQSATEWIHSVGVLIILWCIMGCIFAGLLAAAQSIRDKGDLYGRPSGGCLPGDAGCTRSFGDIKPCGVFDRATNGPLVCS